MSTLTNDTERDTFLKQADDCRNSGRVSDAVVHYGDVYTYCHDRGDHQRAGEALQMIGVSYKINNDKDSSLTHLFKALRYFSEHGLLAGMGNTMRDIAITYEYAGEYETALANMDAALAILKSANDSGYGITLAKKGVILLRLGYQKQGIHCLLDALPCYIEDSADWFYHATIRMHFAEACLTEGSYDECIGHLQVALDLFNAHSEHDHRRRLAQIYGGLAACHVRMGDWQSARMGLALAERFIAVLETESARNKVKQDIKYDETKALITEHDAKA